jgi:tRNA threonylcarbamoyladenosine biosynthesis protein TsaE
VSTELHEVQLADSAATEALGAQIARYTPWLAPQGLTVFLQGELGAGKTTLAQGLLRQLGVGGVVRSPTYSLVEHYDVASGFVLHADLYRLGGADDIEQLALRDAYQRGTLLLVEWPERAAEQLPIPELVIELQVLGERRQAQLRAASPLGRDWLARFDASLIV